MKTPLTLAFVLSVPLAVNAHDCPTSEVAELPLLEIPREITQGDALVSLMAVGANNCEVSVCGQSLGKAPQFKKSVPAKQCQVEVSCDARRYSKSFAFESGKESRIIVKPNEWEVLPGKRASMPGDSQISVMVVGADHCALSIDGKTLGFAPLFKRSVPEGEQVLRVKCSRGRVHTKDLTLKKGKEEKVIVRFP